MGFTTGHLARPNCLLKKLFSRQWSFQRSIGLVGNWRNIAHSSATETASAFVAKRGVSFSKKIPNHQLATSGRSGTKTRGGENETQEQEAFYRPPAWHAAWLVALSHPPPACRVKDRQISLVMTREDALNRLIQGQIQRTAILYGSFLFN